MVGLYFTDRVPEEQAFSLLMRNDDIDIPAGATDHVIEDSLTQGMLQSAMLIALGAVILELRRISQTLADRDGDH